MKSVLWMGLEKFKHCSARVTFVLPVFFACASAAPPSITPPPQTQNWIQVSSQEVSDASLVLVSVPAGAEISDPTKLKAYLAGVEYPFYLDSERKVFEAVVAVPYDHPDGQAEVQLVYRLGEEKKTWTTSVTVKRGEYFSETLTVDPSRVTPPKKAMKRIERESKEVGALYQIERTEKDWKGPFAFPISSPITSPFGSKRVYNGKLAGFHKGLDLKASVGTPIHAPSGGRVVLAKDLYYTGNTVIVDHGYGIFTVYGHMSKLRVKRGQKVKTGDLLGLAGATGRANGPHLHWGAVVKNIKVNPLELTKVLR